MNTDPASRRSEFDRVMEEIHENLREVMPTVFTAPDAAFRQS